MANPLAQLDPSCVWNPNKDETAIAALMRLKPERNEQAGQLFVNDKGEYCYSLPVSSNDRGSFRFRAVNKPEMRFAGLYHTHPYDGGAEKYDKFPEDDIDMADALKKDSYIRVMYDDSIRKYMPGESKVETKAYDSSVRGKTSKGTDITPKILAAAIRNAK